MPNDKLDMPADLDLFSDDVSSLVLSDEQLLAIHGGSCVGSFTLPPTLAPDPFGPYKKK